MEKNRSFSCHNQIVQMMLDLYALLSHFCYEDNQDLGLSSNCRRYPLATNESTLLYLLDLRGSGFFVFRGWKKADCPDLQGALYSLPDLYYLESSLRSKSIFQSASLGQRNTSSDTKRYSYHHLIIQNFPKRCLPSYGYLHKVFL